MKSWQFIAGGALAAFGIYMIRLNRTSEQLQTVITAKIHEINFSALTINIDVKLKNPTNGTMRLQYPFIRLSHQGSVIGLSQASNEQITLPQFGETDIRGIKLRIPLTKLAGLAAQLWKLAKDPTQSIAIDATVVTTIYTALGSGIPYSNTESILLKKANPTTSNAA